MGYVDTREEDQRDGLEGSKLFDNWQFARSVVADGNGKDFVIADCAMESRYGCSAVDNFKPCILQQREAIGRVHAEMDYYAAHGKILPRSRSVRSEIINAESYFRHLQIV